MQNCRRGRTLLVIIGVLCGCRTTESPGPIGLEMVGTIPGPEGEPGFPGFVSVSPVLRDGRRIAYLPDAPGEAPWILDSHGRPTGRLGSVGEGPGQFRQVSAIIRGAGDSVILLDVYRVHVLSPNLEYVRSFPSPVGSTWYPSQLAGGKLALPNRSHGATSAITVISGKDGTVLWTVPADKVHPGSFPDLRVTSSGPDGSLWVARIMRRLEFVQYSPDGALIATHHPSSAWFEPYESYQGPSRTTPSSPVLRSFWIDSAGRAWVVAHVADPKWAEAEGEVRRGEGGIEYFAPKRVEAVRDALIDVIDLRTGTSLGTYRRDLSLSSSAEFGLVAANTTTEDGWMQLQLFRIDSQF